MRLTNAANILRAAGLRVVERPGWRNRDNGRDLRSARGLTVHHTAGSPNSSVEGELRVLEKGRPGLSGPISQFMVARDGTWYCVAAGAANHNKVGWAGPNSGYGNSDLIGVECQHSGAGEEWTDRQYGSVVRGVAALARGYGFRATRVAGHKEHQPGEKVDPSFSMSNFRAAVAAAITRLNQEDDMPSAEEIAAAVWAYPLRNPYSDQDQPAGTILRYVPSRQGHLDTQALIRALDAARVAYERSEDETDAAVVGSLAEIRTMVEQLRDAADEPAEPTDPGDDDTPPAPAG